MDAVVIVAAGRGHRAFGGQGLPKQYRPIAGRSVLARTLEAFVREERLGPMVVVIHPDDRTLYEAAIEEAADAFANNFASNGETAGRDRARLKERLLAPVAGGAERQESVLRGLEALETHSPDRVLIHDAARPFVDGALIARVLAALETAPGAIPGLPVADTLKRVDAEGLIETTIPRAGLWRVQTPQGFRFAEILAAHRTAAEAVAEGRAAQFTDDAAIAEWAGLSVKVVAGSAANVKLTTAEDFVMAEKHLQSGKGGMEGAATEGGAGANEMAGTTEVARTTEIAGATELRVGQGFDVHAFADANDGDDGTATAGRPLLLCGVAIPDGRPLAGHSDADVALHALTDAILGALVEADIGAHFPPSDPAHKGAPSERFLRDAAARVAARGGVITHVDLTIICEAPKIAPHRAAMRARVADILALAPARVSIKATTTEGLGFTGRGEGIAALATATVRLPANANRSD